MVFITCPQVDLTQVVDTAWPLHVPSGQQDWLPLGLALVAPRGAAIFADGLSLSS